MINVSSADSISFVGNVVKHSGSEGISFINDVINSSITGNYITDIAGSGITVGHPQHLYLGDGGAHEKYPAGVEGICTNNSISNNVLYNISSQPGFGGHAGITAFFVSALSITYNHIQTTAYNGINLGWGWRNFTDSTTCKNNTVSYNRLINTLSRLHDSGAVYTLGQMPGTNINSNYVKGIPAATSGPTYGLHNDEGSAYITENDNVLDISPNVTYTINCEDFGAKHDLTIRRTYATVNKMGVNPPNSVIDPPVAVSDNIWPQTQYNTCVGSGIQDAYRSVMPSSLLSPQDYVFPASASVAVGTSSLTIRSAGDPAKTVWFAPAGTTDFHGGRHDDQGRRKRDVDCRSRDGRHIQAVDRGRTGQQRGRIRRATEGQVGRERARARAAETRISGARIGVRRQLLGMGTGFAFRDAATSRQGAEGPGNRGRHLGIAVAVFLAYVNLSGVARAQTPKPFIDYIKPTPIVCSPLSSATWGVAGVLPRDTCNGIESARGAAVPPEFYYWDGQIIKAKDGKYHMFMSTWSGTAGFNPGWQRLRRLPRHQRARGAGALPTARVRVHQQRLAQRAQRVCARAAGRHLRGRGQRDRPLHHLQVDLSRRSVDRMCRPDPDQWYQDTSRGTDAHYASNVSLVPRHDGRFQIVQRHGFIAIADTLCGPYRMQKPTWTYPAANLPNRRQHLPEADLDTGRVQSDLRLGGGSAHLAQRRRLPRHLFGLRRSRRLAPVFSRRHHELEG